MKKNVCPNLAECEWVSQQLFVDIVPIFPDAFHMICHIYKCNGQKAFKCYGCIILTSVLFFIRKEIGKTLFLMLIIEFSFD